MDHFLLIKIRAGLGLCDCFKYRATHVLFFVLVDKNIAVESNNESDMLETDVKNVKQKKNRGNSKICIIHCRAYKLIVLIVGFNLFDSVLSSHDLAILSVPLFCITSTN